MVGSVAGQRYWSSMLNLESTITCGIWTADDQQVYFGTTQGQIIVMDVHGAMVSQVQLCSDVGITNMAWSCEKFKMEEGEDTEPGVSNACKKTFRALILTVEKLNKKIFHSQAIVCSGCELSKWLYLSTEIVRRCITSPYKYWYEWIVRFCYGMEQFTRITGCGWNISTNHSIQRCSNCHVLQKYFKFLHRNWHVIVHNSNTEQHHHCVGVDMGS